MRLRIDNMFYDPEQIEGAAANGRYRSPSPHRREPTCQAILLSSCRSAGASVPFGVDVPAAASGGAKLFKLAVGGLPVHAEAGTILRVSFGHILLQM